MARKTSPEKQRLFELFTYDLLWPAAAGNFLWVSAELIIELFTIQSGFWEHFVPLLSLIAFSIYGAERFHYISKKRGAGSLQLHENIFNLIHPFFLIFTAHGILNGGGVAFWCILILLLSTSLDHIWTAISTNKSRRKAMKLPQKFVASIVGIVVLMIPVMKRKELPSFQAENITYPSTFILLSISFTLALWWTSRSA